MNNEKQAQPEGQTRSQQTWTICTFIGVIAVIALGISMSGPDDRYPNCERGFLGWESSEFKNCKYDTARRRLRSMY